MPHNPIKSIKIDFHTADGVTPKPQPVDKPLGDPAAGGDLQQSGGQQVQTHLSPLHEVLFKHWATANGVEDPDSEDNHYDYRGIFQQNNGQIAPMGAITRAAATFNHLKQNPVRPELLAPGLGTADQANAQKQQILSNPNPPDQLMHGVAMGAAGIDEPIQKLLSLLPNRGQ